MAISKKPKESRLNSDRKTIRFIDNGASVKEDKMDKPAFTNVVLRIPQNVLEKTNTCVKRKPWMNRTQWIIEAINAKLDREF